MDDIALQLRDLEGRIAELESALSEERRLRLLAERRLAIHNISGLPTHFRMEQEILSLLDDLDTDPDHAQCAFIIAQLDAAYTMVKRTTKSSVSEWILYQCAERLLESIGAGDRIFHSRENEFIIVMRFQERVGLEESIRRLMDRLHEPHIFSGFNVSIGVAMGISLYPSDGRDKQGLLHKADIALMACLDRHRSALYYKKEYEDSALEKMEIQASIIKAIEAPALRQIASQFELYYQPKLRLAEVAQGGVRVAHLDAEALIRWKHPERGLISPDSFIPVAEDTGLILPIGKWVLYQVAKRLESWRGMEGVGISLNLSSKQFRNAELLELIKQMFNQRRDLAQRITIEITETSIFENGRSALAIIETFKSLGLRVSVDDFGTGYSSLSHLHRFPLDEIKIDKSFIANYPDNPRDVAIVNSLASIAKHLGIGLVAEGVERPEQLGALHALGCSIQGYIFSKPLPESEFISWVKRLKKAGMSLAVDGAYASAGA